MTSIWILYAVLVAIPLKYVCKAYCWWMNRRTQRYQRVWAKYGSKMIKYQYRDTRNKIW